MVPPAAESTEFLVGASKPGRIPALLELLRSSDGRGEFALRLALICALTTLVVEIYQTPDAALTVYVAFFLNKPDRAESILLCVVFTLLITVIIGLVAVTAMLVVDFPFWRLVFMTAFSMGFLFVAFASKLRALAGTITLIVAYALDLLGTVHAGELATRALLYAWLFVGIPAAVSLLVNLVLGPAPRRLIERALAERLRAAAEALHRPQDYTVGKLVDLQQEGISELESWLKLAAMEKTSRPEDIVALKQATESTLSILSWVEHVMRDSRAFEPGAAREELARKLEGMAQILEGGRYPIDIELSQKPANRAWVDMQHILAQFAQSRSAPPPASAPARSGFLLPDAFTNPEYVRYALKTTAAAMFCYILYSLLDWPGIHTCFITCYIVSLGTTAETIEKLSLRIVGCLLGAAAGIAAIVFIMPSLTSITGLFSVVFLGALAAAWVAAGSPRIAYAGFQIAFAFFLCIIQGPSPSFDLVTARDRIIGILLGNVVVYLLFTRLWPVSIADRIGQAIGGAFRSLALMVETPDPDARRALALKVHRTVPQIREDVDLAGYEPAQIRSDRSWLEASRRATELIDTLHPLLLFRTTGDRSLAAEAAQQLRHLAEAFATKRPAPPLPDSLASLPEIGSQLSALQSLTDTFKPKSGPEPASAST